MNVLSQRINLDPNVYSPSGQVSIEPGTDVSLVLLLYMYLKTIMAKFRTDPRRINPKDPSDLLTFPLAPPSGPTADCPDPLPI